MLQLKVEMIVYQDVGCVITENVEKCPNKCVRTSLHCQMPPAI